MPKNISTKLRISSKPSILKWKFENYRIVDENGCWLWTQRKDKDGYGRLTFQGRSTSVHRLSLWFYKGFNLDSGLMVLHLDELCKSRACFNPDHLKSGTNRDNMKDAIIKGTFVGLKHNRRGNMKGNHA